MSPIPMNPDPAPERDASEDRPSRSTADLAGDPLKTLEIKPRVIEALSSIYDPEIPVNIYDLGLIYDVIVDRDATVGVRMTLTAPACPAAQILPGQVEAKVKELDGVSDAFVEIVWDPAWDKDRMSDAAKLALGML